MNKDELQAIAQTAAKNIKSEEELNEFRQMLTKITVEAALNAELEDHLGFARHEQSDKKNNRNGTSSKTLQTEDGQFELETPPCVRIVVASTENEELEGQREMTQCKNITQMNLRTPW